MQGEHYEMIERILADVCLEEGLEYQFEYSNDRYQIRLFGATVELRNRISLILLVMLLNKGVQPEHLRIYY